MNDLVMTSADARAVTDRFGGFDVLTVRQRKKWAEILLSFEMKNQYDVFQGGAAVLRVAEQGEGVGAFFRRVVLGPMRPFEAHVVDAQTGAVLLKLRRPWRWVFHRLEVFSGDDQPLGAVEKRWSWVRRIYSILGPNGQQVGDIFGPFLRPWTFEVRNPGGVIGSIQKKWSGLGKEMFTDADNFGVDLQMISDPMLKVLVFAATVLVDIVHFERSKG